MLSSISANTAYASQQQAQAQTETKNAERPAEVKVSAAESTVQSPPKQDVQPAPVVNAFGQTTGRIVNTSA